jgi:two-component system, cell cycle sensor histidine kinase and response regulator CckA
MASGKDTESLLSRIQSIYRSNPAGMGVVLNRILVEANTRLFEMTGYSAEELVGKDARILYLSDGEYERVVRDGLDQIARQGTAATETRWRRKDGTWFEVLVSSSPIRLGRLEEGLTFGALDISARRSAESAIRLSEERYRLLFDSISDAVLVHPFHEDGSPEIFVEVNQAACARLGYSRQELLAMSSYDIDAPEGLAVAADAMRKLKAEGYVAWEGTHVTRDGRKIPVEITNRLFEMDGKQMILATIRDISDRRNAEHALREHQETMHALLNATTDLAVLIEPGGTLLACNEAFARSVGAEAAERLTGTSVWDMEGIPLDARVREKAAEVARTSQPARIEVARESSVYDFVIVPIPGPGAGLRLAFFIRDVTVVRRTEDQLRQSQKMEAVGRLAGGIAHDFNNLITVIRGFSELVLGELPADSRMAEDIAQVKGASDRAAELTARLLTFSRKQVLAPRVVDPAALVRGIEGMLRRVIAEDIEILTDLAADTGRIMADAGQVEQVMMNLAVNARDAMPRGGTLSIASSNHSVQEALSGAGSEFPGLTAGEYVRLRISDTGHGMDRLTMSRIFEPFFTTKEPGKGTGMGLSTVYGIVTQSGGRIYCTSAPGEGTTFTMFFPRLLGPAAEPVRQELRRRPAAGTGTVLLVEDEAAVRGYARRVLENGGYQVLEAGNGESALQIAERERDAIHLLLTDVVMPGMGGPELASRIAGFLPSVRTLFISGYGRPALERRGALTAGSPLLGKPFDEHGLLEAVRQVLSA